VKTAAKRLAGAQRPLQLLLVAVVLVPLGLFASAAWLNYRWAFDEARTELARTTDAVHEHALKVFETNELVLDRLAERYGALDWNTIETSPEVHLYLKRVAQSVAHIAVLGFISPDQRVVATNLDLPAAPARRHVYLPVHRDDNDDLLISELDAGRYSGGLRFLVARRMPLGAHVPDGNLIFASIRAEYFQRYYGAAFGPDYTISIIRADGTMLARFPALPENAVLSPETGFRRSIADGGERGDYSSRSGVDGQDRLFSYRKLGNYPVYIVGGIDRATVLRDWWQNMSSHLVFGIPATLALIGITLVALRRTAGAHAAFLQAERESNRRQQLEASLHQAQKMEAVGQLTGGVAHDFNNLLTAIMGSLEMIVRGGEAGEMVRKYAAAAMRAAERGARLTQQLLAFSRRQVLRPEIVNVNRMLGEFETLMQRAVGESIRLVLTLDPEVDPCRVDPAQFQAAVLNLVVNARDATPAGGHISIESRNVVLAADSSGALDPEVAPGRYVMVAVADTGRGMTADVRAQAFDPFFTTKEVGKGSGLGLSQVYGFAKQSGGHATVESEPDRGTTVRVYLPSVEAPTAVQSESMGELRRAGAKNATVLAVEDDEAVLDTVEASLAGLGYRTLTARNAAEALSLLRRDEPIDLLFTDIVMPGGMNGVALAREARQLRQDIKVLLTSGYSATMAKGHGGEGFAVLSKPYRQAQLADMRRAGRAALTLNARRRRGVRLLSRIGWRPLSPRRCRERRCRGEIRCASPRRSSDPIAHRRKDGRSGGRSEATPRVRAPAPRRQRARRPSGPPDWRARFEAPLERRPGGR
jgi:two-component system, NtrC family, sensor kinase